MIARRLLIGIFCLIQINTLLAQSPRFLSYQAILRDADGALLKETDVNLKFLIQLAAGEKTVYAESFSTTTNSQALISHKIGSGTVISGVFSEIDWSTGLHFLTVELQYGGGDFVNIGSTQLL